MIWQWGLYILVHARWQTVLFMKNMIKKTHQYFRVKRSRRWNMHCTFYDFICKKIHRNKLPCIYSTAVNRVYWTYMSIEVTTVSSKQICLSVLHCMTHETSQPIYIETSRRKSTKVVSYSWQINGTKKLTWSTFFTQSDKSKTDDVTEERNEYTPFKYNSVRVLNSQNCNKRDRYLLSPKYLKFCPFGTCML